MNDFIMGRLIGKGAFGSVSLVTRKKDDKVYAMKRVNIGKLNNKEKESSLNEIRILASLSHPNIIGYKEAFFDQSTNTLNIVMEFADEGDLEKKIKNNLKKRLNFEENTIWKWIIQLLQGIKYLHDNRIMHRDLKCANIFLMKNGLLKLGDLNVSKFAKLGMANTQTGTPYYCSPEIWKEKSYDYKSDIWSLGCIIYEICSLRPPFRGTSLKGLRNNVLNGHYLPIPSIYSNDLSILISKMLVIDPSKRASAKDLLKDDIIVNRIRNMNNQIFSKDIKDGYNKEKANLIKTIRLPLNIKEINSKLPKKRYNPEEEMMKNDEYETMKQTFFQNLKEEEEKNKNNNKKHKSDSKEKKSSVHNNNNKYLKNYKKDNKEINHHNSNKKIESHHNKLKHRQIENNINKNNNNNNSVENKKSNDYYIKDFNYHYEQALNNNHKLKKFNTKKTNYEEQKVKNNIYNIESNPKNILMFNFLNDNNININKKMDKNKSEKNHLILNNINNNNYIKIDNKNFPISPYNIIINEDNNINNIFNNKNVNKKSRYKNLFSDEIDNDKNHSENHYNNKQYSEVKKPLNHPQSAVQRHNKLNLKTNERNYNNYKINKSKNRPMTNIPSHNNINKQNNLKGDYKKKKNVNVNNLYDKYKNKNKKEQKAKLYGFKYVPQKRQVYKIAYDKLNYNDYCKKNNIDKNKNYHYYRENGYYNYRNAMKKYANFVHNKNIAHKKKANNEIQNQNKFNIYLKNEYKGGGGAGYAARIRMQRYNK